MVQWPNVGHWPGRGVRVARQLGRVKAKVAKTVPEATTGSS